MTGKVASDFAVMDRVLYSPRPHGHRLLATVVSICTHRVGIKVDKTGDFIMALPDKLTRTGGWMRKQEALKLIDDHKNKLVNPVEMLHWTWLRVIVLQISDDDWEKLVGKATEILAR